jgi:hypothetical protein
VKQDQISPSYFFLLMHLEAFFLANLVSICTGKGVAIGSKKAIRK